MGEAKGWIGITGVLLFGYMLWGHSGVAVASPASQSPATPSFIITLMHYFLILLFTGIATPFVPWLK